MPSPNDYFDLTHYAHAPLFAGCDHPWQALDRLAAYLKEQPLGIIAGEISTGAHLINPELISIGEGSVVEPGAYIKGPCIIGRNCQIRHGAYLRGQIVTGDKCVIGHATEIKHAILLDGAQAAHFAYVGDSILGNRTNLGAGAKCANLRFDRANIQIAGHDTQRHKLGLILGDEGQLGCNAVTNPGTLMGKKSCSFPGVTLSGVIAPNELVKKS